QRVDFSPDNDPSTPDEWFYAMEDYVLLDLDNLGASCRSAGALERLRLPTGGKLRWTYKNATFPAGSTKRPFSQKSNSVITRETLRPNNTTIGTWTYARDSAASFDQEQSLTVMTDPLNNVTKSYFSVYSGLSDDASEGWTVREYGLPLTRRAALLDAADAPGLFLSSETFEAGATAPVRSTWVRYEHDLGVIGEFDVMSSVNARLATDRTVYEDDCANSATPCAHRYKSASRTSWDNLGHYRLTTLGGNFPSANTLVAEKGYNLSGVKPPVTQPWLLERYTFSRTDAGGGSQSYSRYSFDATTGALLSKAINFTGTSTADARDVVDTYTRAAGFRGFVSAETVSGGDTGTAFTKNFTWTCGVLATSRIQNATYFTVDHTIDCASGLATSERDMVGQQTTFGYDVTGRLTVAHPPGEADVVTTYAFATGSPLGSKVTTVRRNGVTELMKQESEYDELGRLRSETRFRHEFNGAGVLTTLRDIQKRTYDAAGNQDTDSTIVDSVQAASPPTMRYQQFDAFGRPHHVVKPDGATVTLLYAGDFSRTSIVGVGRSFSSTGAVQEMGSEKTERFDRLGRLWKVTEQAEDAPNGTNLVRCATGAGFSTNPFDCYTDTLYTYDEAGRLERVQSSADGATQIRELRYDARGFLQAEIHPELDLVGSTGVDVQYGSYNALGMPGFRRDAVDRVDFIYDAFARLLRVDETYAGGTRWLRKFRYGTSNGDRSNGRIVEATRYNYRNIGGADQVIGITELLQYLGTGGRVSNETLQAANALGTSHTALDGVTGNESFTTGYTYDTLGMVTRIDYPQCTFAQGQCNGAIAAPRSVNFDYRDGLLVGVPGFTGETVPGTGTTSGITYHPNGLWNKVAYSSGAVYTQVNDPNGLPRPQSFDLTRGATVDRIGPYVYDSAGNIVKIGNEKHLYDLTSRVWKSQMDDGVNGQEYRYDGFGNIQAIVSGVAANDRPTTTSVTTNRLAAPATYDGAGRMTGWSGRQYVYDAAGTLASESIPATAPWAAETWYYMYTARGERVWAFSPAVNRPRRDRWTLRGLNQEVLREYSADNYAGWSNAKDYVWRNGTQLLASVTPAEGARHFFSDQIRTTRLITTSTGANVAYVYAFLPFGEQIGAVGPVAEPTSRYERIRFAGQERDLHDPGSYADDLDSMHARAYSPLLGRFTRPDDVSGNMQVPQTWNRYAYAANNPVRFRDAMGRTPGNSETSAEEQDVQQNECTMQGNAMQCSDDIINVTAELTDEERAVWGAIDASASGLSDANIVDLFVKQPELIIRAAPDGEQRFAPLQMQLTAMTVLTVPTSYIEFAQISTVIDPHDLAVIQLRSVVGQALKAYGSSNAGFVGYKGVEPPQPLPSIVVSGHP
ncbi:MAG: hypothetical protein QOH21_1923, partial [Acidobacteriota bacterium]|nr:hypothetical protein [Acidobacteriota bacterium]